MRRPPQFHAESFQSASISAPMRTQPNAQLRRVVLAGTSEPFQLLFLLVAIISTSGFLPENRISGLVVTFAHLVLGMMLLARFRQLQQLPYFMWNALVCFRLGVAIFVGFGNAVPFLIDYVSLRYIYFVYPGSDHEALRLLLMAALCTLVVLTIARFFSIRFPAASQQRRRIGSKVMSRMAIVFLIVETVFSNYLWPKRSTPCTPACESMKADQRAGFI